MRDITRKEFLHRAAAGAITGSLLGTGCITTKAMDTMGLTPVAGEIVLAPHLKASTFDTGVGITIQADNVTVVNPRLEDFAEGVRIQRKPDGNLPKDCRVIFDPNAAGAAGSGIFHCRTGVSASRFENLEVGGVGGGYLRFRRCYRNVTIEGGVGGNFHHCDIMGPSFVFPKGNGEVGSIVGIKALADYTLGAPYECSHHLINDNVVASISEEGISFDPASTDSAPMARETNTISSVQPAYHRITLSDSGWNNKDDVFGGYFVVFLSGAAKGHFLQIASQSGPRLTLVDPDDVLLRVKVGNKVTIGMPYHHNVVANNHVDATDSRVGISFGGFSFRGLIEGNRVTGYADYDYPDYFNLRQVGGVTAPQAIRIGSQTEVSGSGTMIGNARWVPSAMNSVVGNSTDGDLSLHLIRLGQNVYTSPNYWAHNAITGSGQLWVKDHTLLASPPA